VGVRAAAVETAVVVFADAVEPLRQASPMRTNPVGGVSCGRELYFAPREKRTLCAHE
jgi:hypothetical protein